MIRLATLCILAFLGAFISGCSNPLGGGDSKIDENYNPGAPIATMPSAPANLAATSSVSQVDLTWTASTIGVTPIAYTVYRSTTSGSGYAALAACINLSANNCTDTTVVNGMTYYYVVRAHNADGTSGNSNEASAVPGALPSALTLSRTITQASRMDLSWTASTGTGSITYTLRRSTTSGSGYTDVAGCVGLSTTTCNDSSVTAGTTYYYIVTATNAVGSTSSNEVSATPMAAFTITLTPGHRQIQASFSSAGATAYSLQYGTATGSYSTTLPGATSPTTVSSLINGTTYYFMVTATNAAGSITASAEVSAAPNGPQYFNISSATEGNSQVALVWGASTGATSYNVYYGTSSGIYTTTFATGITGTSSTVTGLTNGTTYYFMVTAVNANGSQDAGVEFIRTPAQPTLSLIQNINYDSIHNQFVTPGLSSSWSTDINFTLGGLSQFTCNGNVNATSSDTAVIPNSALTVSGTYPNCRLGISVSAGISGTTTIILTASHGFAVANQGFQFKILPIAAAVYSLRKAVMGYSGSALRIRRAQDNSESDISFLPDGYMNDDSISSFLYQGNIGGLVLAPNDISATGWQASSSITRTVDVANAPDGQNTADRISVNPNVTFKSLAWLFNPTSGTHTYGVWVKPETIRYIQLRYSISIGNGAAINFDLVNKTLQVAGGTPVGQITEGPDGWVRVSITNSLVSGAGSVAIAPVQSLASPSAEASGIQGNYLVSGFYLSRSSVDGFVTATVSNWYDQSGNGRHATTSNTYQPFLYRWGVPSRLSSSDRLAIQTSVVGQRLETPWTINNATALSLSAVMVRQGTLAPGISSLIAGTNNVTGETPSKLQWRTGTGDDFRSQSVSALISPLSVDRPLGLRVIAQMFWESQNNISWTALNGVESVPTSAGFTDGFDSSTLRLFNYNNSSDRGFIGLTSEMLFFDQTLSPNDNQGLLGVQRTSFDINF